VTRRHPRIIGLGNALRGDDAVGLVVAQRVRELLPGADILELSGEPAELLDALGDGVEHVVLVDAVTSGALPGTVHRLDASQAALVVEANTTTHGLGLAETIELGRALGRLPARLLLYGIEGQDFALGAPLSPAVARAADALVVELAGHGPDRPVEPVTRYGREGGAGC
jgi:hydrogenase maturation protease